MTDFERYEHARNELKGHGHWVNTLALNTDHVLRSGPYSQEAEKFKDLAEKKAHPCGTSPVPGVSSFKGLLSHFDILYRMSFSACSIIFMDRVNLMNFHIISSRRSPPRSATTR